MTKVKSSIKGLWIIHVTIVLCLQLCRICELFKVTTFLTFPLFQFLIKKFCYLGVDTL